MNNIKYFRVIYEIAGNSYSGVIRNMLERAELVQNLLSNGHIEVRDSYRHPLMTVMGSSVKLIREITEEDYLEKEIVSEVPPVSSAERMKIANTINRLECVDETTPWQHVAETLSGLGYNKVANFIRKEDFSMPYEIKQSGETPTIVWEDRYDARIYLAPITGVWYMTWFIH
jgi:hypothetical protein